MGTTWAAAAPPPTSPAPGCRTRELLASLWAAAVERGSLVGRRDCDRACRWPSIPAPGRIGSGGRDPRRDRRRCDDSATSFIAATNQPPPAGRANQVDRIHADARRSHLQGLTEPRRDRRAGRHRPCTARFGAAFQIESDTGFDAQADRLGWIAVYPDGVADVGTRSGAPTNGQASGSRRRRFISALIDHFEATDKVEPEPRLRDRNVAWRNDDLPPGLRAGPTEVAAIARSRAIWPRPQDKRRRPVRTLTARLRPGDPRHRRRTIPSTAARSTSRSRRWSM